VFCVAFEHSVVSFIDLLYRYHLNVPNDAVFSAEIKHLLCLEDATNGRAGQLTPGQLGRQRTDVMRPDRAKRLPASAS